MPSRHRIDTSVRFDRNAKLPEERAIEVAAVAEMPKTNPKTETVKREAYRASPGLEEAVNLAIALGRPLLLQGDPGCGKTRLAYAVAYALGLPLEECYIKSTSRAQDLLYTYDAVSRLYDAQLERGDTKGAARDRRSLDAANYVRPGPLGRAIVRGSFGRRSVVLIDEIDKADLDFPNDLLRELDRLEFEVTEVGDASGRKFSIPTDRPTDRPIIFVTHNEEKALPVAFLRRCVFHFVEFPSDPRELEQILSLHELASPELGARAIAVLLRLRELDLTKKPGLSELLDWVGYLQAVQTPLDQLDKVPFPGVLLKQALDQQRVREDLSLR